MRCCEYPVSSAFQLRGVQLQIHELVHVLQHEHIAVQLHHSVVFHQAERRKFTPAVVEARFMAVILFGGGQEISDTLFSDMADVESGVARGREVIGIESNEGIGRLYRFEGVVEGEETREVFRVCDKGCPDLVTS